MTADPGRLASLRALLAVGRGSDLDHTLARMRSGIDNPGAAREAEELVRGALQWQGRYDHLVANFSRRQASAEPTVLAVLRLAMHELLTHTTIPAYATLHQAGELLGSVGRKRAGGYVNAVLQALRRYLDASAASDPLEAIRPLFVALPLPVDELAAWWSHPTWLVSRWLGRYGREGTEALLAHATTPPLISLHVLPSADLDDVTADLSAAGLAFEGTATSARVLCLKERCDRHTLTGFFERRPETLVQDAAAVAAIDWLTRDGADLQGACGPILDMCAAPGGKAAHLCALLSPTEHLVAMDLRPRRLERVRQNRDRLGLDNLTLLAGDGLKPPIKNAAFSTVLLDGPCSGTGVMRHHPEGRWRLTEDTIARNATRLQQLAESAADLLSPRGRLYYATCSLEQEENEDVVTALLTARDDLAPDPDEDGTWHRAWLPWRQGTDGFFAARLRRRPVGGD